MYLMYHRRTKPTGSVLAALLNIPCGSAESSYARDVLIRWGTQRGCGVQPERTLNYRQALARVSDKLEFLINARDSLLPVPKAGTNPEYVGYPCLGRDNNRAGGRGITFMASPEQVVTCDFYSEYLPVSREFRVHVYDRGCLAIQEKVLQEGADRPTEFVPRNHANGYVFKRKNPDYYPVIRAIGLAAMDVSRLHFGAVDVVVDTEGRVYVLEINSAPALEKSTLADYTRAFARDLGLDMDVINQRLNDTIEEDDGLYERTDEVLDDEPEGV